MNVALNSFPIAVTATVSMYRHGPIKDRLLATRPFVAVTIGLFKTEPGAAIPALDNFVPNTPKQ
jgi:hypothetical protein